MPGIVIGLLQEYALPLDFIIVVAVVVSLYLFFVRYGLGRVLTYRLTNEEVQVVLFGALPVSRTRYDRIKGAKRVGFREIWSYPHAWRWGYRVGGPFVLIHRRAHLPVALTPDDPEEFVRQVRRRVYETTGGWV